MPYGSGYDQYQAYRKNAITYWAQQESRYYRVPSYGLFDMEHVDYSVSKIQDIQSQVWRAAEDRTTVRFRQPVRGNSEVVAEYWVRKGEITAEEVRQISISIVMNLESNVERHQWPGSSHAFEDLPSDYLGWYVGLHQGTTAPQVLKQLGSGNDPEPIGKVAYIWKLWMGKNFEFTPMPQPSWKSGDSHADWPLWFSIPMQPSRTEGQMWGVVQVSYESPNSGWRQSLDSGTDWLVQGFD